MNESDESGEQKRKATDASAGEFTAAVERLEKAVQEVVTVTTGQLSERAAGLIDDTTKRLEAELRLRRVADEDEVDAQQEHRRRGRRSRHRLADRAEQVNPRSGRLYRDPKNEKIGGVCAGLARYFGVDTWAVRGIGLAGLFMLPGVVFPAYWIAYFVMDTPEGETSERKSKRASRRSRRRSRLRGRKGGREAESQTAEAPLAAGRKSSKRDNPEVRERFVAARTLKRSNADFSEAELRLRRLESFVTSDQYDLHRELAIIERDEVRTSG